MVTKTSSLRQYFRENVSDSASSDKKEESTVSAVTPSVVTTAGRMLETNFSLSRENSCLREDVQLGDHQSAHPQSEVISADPII